jgi:hypothetical protein
MIQKNTEIYKMEFYNSYVIIESTGRFVIDPAIAINTIQMIVDHFKGKEFVIISNRKSDYTISPEAYSNSIFKKIKGIAIVSSYPQVKLKAVLEQENFRQSFAFFEDLENAKKWAESFFVNY